MALVDAFCSYCALDRSNDPELDATTRTLCPACRQTSALTYKRTMHAVTHTTSSVSYVMTPGNQERGWKLRWRSIQQSLTFLEMPRSGGPSGPAIEAAEREVLGWFVEANHLRDALISDGAITKADVKNALKTLPALGLLADVANLDKHAVLTMDPWTGCKPKLLSRAGASVAGGWQLRLTIEHHGKRLDALVIARKALTAWEQFLQSKGLL